MLSGIYKSPKYPYYQTTVMNTRATKTFQGRLKHFWHTGYDIIVGLICAQLVYALLIGVQSTSVL